MAFDNLGLFISSPALAMNEQQAKVLEHELGERLRKIYPQTFISCNIDNDTHLLWIKSTKGFDCIRCDTSVGQLVANAYDLLSYIEMTRYIWEVKNEG